MFTEAHERHTLSAASNHQVGPGLCNRCESGGCFKTGDLLVNFLASSLGFRYYHSRRRSRRGSHGLSVLAMSPSEARRKFTTYAWQEQGSGVPKLEIVPSKA